MRRRVVATVFSVVLATPVCWPRLLDSPTGSYACSGSSSRVPGRCIRAWDTLEWFRAWPALVSRQYYYNSDTIIYNILFVTLKYDVNLFILTARVGVTNMRR